MNDLIPYISHTPKQVEGLGVAGKIKRGDTWHLRMRVPKRYKSIEKRGEIQRSLKTGDRAEADARLAVVERQILAELDARLAGEAPDAGNHYHAIAALASARGWQYRPVEGLAAGSVSEIVRRAEDLRAVGDEPDSAAATAALGGVAPPRRTIMELAEEMASLNGFEVDNKNKQQTNDWNQKWRRVGGKLKESIGADIVVDDITRDDIVKLRNELQVRVNEGALKVDSADKELQYLGRMIRDHNKSLDRKDFSIPTEGVRCEAVIRSKKSRKPPIPLPYLDKWIYLGNWRGINDELRDIMLVCLETGARGSEIYNLPPHAIVLTHNIPHIRIQEEEAGEDGDGGRQIKNTASERRIPLVGVALEAMRRHPEGFSRYRNNRNFSNSATKSMRARGLIPQEPVRHLRLPGGKRRPVYVTAGGVRHSFEDRLEAVGVESDIRGGLMGHDVGRIRGRQHYGDKSLEERLALHEKIMLRPSTQLLPAPALDDEHDQ